MTDFVDRSIPKVRALPATPLSGNDLITYHEAKGPGSLLDLIDKIRMNLDYKQSRKAIKAGLKPATLYLSKSLKAELPRSRRASKPGRPPGSTAGSVRARLGAPPGRRGLGREPIGRVVLVPPHGYVYNFFKGTGPRNVAIISQARKRGLWQQYTRGVGGWGLGASRGSMPKIFDIESFMERHRPAAIDLMVITFQRLVNAYDLGARPRVIQETPDGQDLD